MRSAHRLLQDHFRADTYGRVNWAIDATIGGKKLDQMKGSNLSIGVASTAHAFAIMMPMKLALPLVNCAPQTYPIVVL